MQARPNLAVTKGWILGSRITGDLKMCTVGIISWYFRSVLREVGNDRFQNQLGLRGLQVGEVPIVLLPNNGF